MRWWILVAAALAVVVVVNVALLSYGGNRHDPVGRLSPVASLPGGTPAPQPRVVQHERDD